jgi:hypothetical protein
MMRNPGPRRILILALIIGVLLLGGYMLTKGNKSSGSSSNTQSSSQKVESKKIEVNQSIDIPVGQPKDGVSIKSTVQTASLTNRIVISKKNQWARKGTRFLMLNFLVENPSAKGVNFKTKDLIRLIDNNGKKFAPSYFNNGLKIEADAVKKDVAGFLVPEDIKVFKIQYGLINGEKKTLELKFD